MEKGSLKHLEVTSWLFAEGRQRMRMDIGMLLVLMAVRLEVYEFGAFCCVFGVLGMRPQRVSM